MLSSLINPNRKKAGKPVQVLTLGGHKKILTGW